MTSHQPVRPETISKHAQAVYPAFAMLAGMDLDVFTALAGGAMSAEALADALGVRSSRLAVLLHALVAADLLTEQGGEFSNTDESDQFLVRDRPDYLGRLHGLHAGFWRAAMVTAESIRADRPVAKRPWSSSPDELRAYFRRQYPSSVRGGKALLETVDFSSLRTLLDAGGGSGGVAAAIAEAYPGVQCTVADLPDVAIACSDFVHESPAHERIARLSIDLTTATPDATFDAAVLRALIQVLSPEDARNVIQHVHDALNPGGRIIITGSFLRDDRRFPRAAVDLGLVFLNVYDQGQAYTESDVTSWLEAAGFEDIAIDFDAIADIPPSCLITAHRP